MSLYPSIISDLPAFFLVFLMVVSNASSSLHSRAHALQGKQTILSTLPWVGEGGLVFYLLPVPLPPSQSSQFPCSISLFHDFKFLLYFSANEYVVFFRLSVFYHMNPIYSSLYSGQSTSTQYQWNSILLESCTVHCHLSGLYCHYSTKT